MHDLDFNPFNDLQAEDRCHRIGQKRKVTVFKLVTEDTVDEDIYAMQQRKTKMNAAIMESNNGGKFDSSSEKDAVLNSAVARFLGSPHGTSARLPGQPDQALLPSSAEAPPSSKASSDSETTAKGSEKENRNGTLASFEMVSEVLL